MLIIFPEKTAHSFGYGWFFLCENYIAISTKINYNLEEIAKENNLKGYFVREALKKLEDGIATREEIEKAIEIGLEAM